MFELSKRTWHYKMYRYLRNFYEDGPELPFRNTWARVDYRPKSLCSYFWTTVLMAMALPFVILIMLIAGTIILILSPIWYPIVHRKRTMDERWLNYKLGNGPKPTTNFIGLRTDREPRKWLVVEWFKAYKDRHCPLVTLVD